MFTYMYAIPPIQFPVSRRGVWFRVHGDVQRTRSTFRAADILSDKGMICYYVDRALCYSFLARFFVQRYNFFCKCAIFFANL